MNFPEWITEAKALEAQAALESNLERGSLTTLLARLHALTCQAPLTFLDLYRRLDEARLREGAVRRMERLIRGNAYWTPARDDPDQWIWAVATQIRAVDELLYNTASTDFGPPLEDLEEWKCQSTGAYVVPRATMLEGDLDRRPYPKRGMRGHRIVPPEIGGIEIRLIRLDLHENHKASGLGASLFANLQLTTRESRAGNFVAERVSFDTPEDSIAAQISQSLDVGCAGVVWPELTVDADTLKLITRILRDRTVFDEDENPLHWLVAGSWHEEHRLGVFRNRATVVDGYGGTILRYDKLIPAQDALGRFEDIEAGDHIPILVTESGLIAFAICRDFCDRASFSSPYLPLPVDLFVVPSMGGDTTMTAHQSVAAEVRAKTGAVTFVVQQTDAREATQGEFGYVLPMLEAPLRPPAMSLKSKDFFSVHTK